MAQMHRQPDSPRTQANPSAVEQLLKGEASKWSPKSPLPSASMIARDHELENDHGNHQKKTVLMKMKDKAKKLRNSFSKRRHGEDIGNINPSWGVTLEDEDEEEDAEYHGAPMYESELAPNEYHQANARNHQNPKLSSEKNALESIKTKSITSPREKTCSPNKDSSSPNKPPPSPTKGVASIKPPSPHQLINQTNMINKFPSPRKATTQCVDSSSPNKVTTGGTAERITDKQAPTYPAVLDETNAITSKIKRVAISKPVNKEISSAPAPALAPALAPLTQNSSVSVTQDSYPLSAPSGAAMEADHSKNQQLDKGVSVKEYIMNKFEPGEDERALSKVISEAMSPRKSPSNTGVVDKVREAVSSLLRNEDSSKRSTDTQSANYSSPLIPVSTNPHEVSEQEKNQGRILQAN